MLEPLCGSKTIQKILLALFVNRKCYGNQLNRLLGISLTPIQKALLRLEKGGVILSYFEGKTKLYQFNPAYPLQEELESLLKKAYTLLPMEEKTRYSFIKQESMTMHSYKDKKDLLLYTWEKLSRIKHLVFHARTKSKEESGWNGNGKGEVVVSRESARVLIFQEKGSWKGENNQEMDFSNVFRWTLDIDAQMISLEHLRRGINHPVFLFHLAPKGEYTLASIDPHLCGEDAYFGQLFCHQQNLRLNWRVIGIKKNEEIDYYYT